MDSYYLSVWRETMALLLVVKIRSMSLESAAKCFRAVEPLTEEAGVTVAQKFATSPHQTAMEAVNDGLSDGFLKIVPVLVEKDENFDSYKNTRALQLHANRYLYLNSAGVVCSEDKTVGYPADCAPDSLIDVMAKLRNEEDQVAAVYAHIAFMVLTDMSTSARMVDLTINHYASEMQELCRQILSIELGRVPNRYMPMGHYKTIMTPIRGYEELKRFPILAIRGKGAYWLRGEFIIYDGAVAYRNAWDEEIMGFRISDPDDKEAYKVYLLLLAHFMGLRNGWKDDPDMEHYKNVAPKGYEDFCKTLTAADRCANISRVYKYLNEEM